MGTTAGAAPQRLAKKLVGTKTVGLLGWVYPITRFQWMMMVRFAGLVQK